MKTINASDYEIYPNDDKENTLKLQSLLEKISSEKDVILNFNCGEYHFYPDYSIEKLLYVSNHDEDTIKRIAFSIDGLENFTIAGNNTSFIFHMDIIPFYLNCCKNISINGIDIDYAMPIYSQGEIMQVNSKQMTIKIDKEKYPFIIKDNRLYFVRENCYYQLDRWLEFDNTLKSPAYQTSDVSLDGVFGGLVPFYNEIEEGVIQLTLTQEKQHFLANSKVGNQLVLRHHLRTHPCFYVTDCENISVKNINIYHTEGMAFLAERTKDIELHNFNVKIKENNAQIFTATADASHFVYCYGKISISNCLMENQLDDSVNIHGIYAKIVKIVSDTELIVMLVHDQQKGVCIGKIGQKLGILDNETMLTYHKTTIKSIVPINKDYIKITLSTPSEQIKINHVVENLTYVPDVHINDCIFKNNRARGLLLTSAGEVLIENNQFSVAGAAILIEGDCNNWFESGGTNNIIIKGNTFTDCGYVSGWGKAPIQVTPSVKKSFSTEKYHKRLTIEGNTFMSFDERLIYARNIEKIIFNNNIIIKTSTYEPIGNVKFDVENQAVMNINIL